jgi:lipid II:glycine glycyltransferase (peptidoglycan interpeptide bridge formation enzyme)
MLNIFKNEAQLFLAEYEGKIIAGGIFTYLNQEAIYYYGASSNKNRNVMAPYLIQWTAIQEAQKRKCKIYDFLGITPEKANKNHPWQGVTSFKKKFGGKIVNYSPAQEIVLKPLIYNLFIMLKKVRNLAF